MRDVAVLGTGNMGGAIAARLLAAGCRVTVWNRTPARVEALVEAGAVAAGTPAGAVAGAELVVIMLTDAAAVEAALFGADGAAAAVGPETVVAQMSTLGPDEVRRIAARLPAVPFVDAPVLGSVGAVTAGTLTILCGGAADALDRAEPVLRRLGTVRRCGPVGAAAALKLVANTALVTALGALADTLAVADAVGVDRTTALDVLAAGPLGAAVRRATATGASFAVALAAKDARLALREAPDASLLAAALQLSTTVPDQTADVAALVSPENRLTLENR
ncbi:NAD(P)-dependent oxidoreductase [Micromonospora zhanjiangensis]